MRRQRILLLCGAAAALLLAAPASAADVAPAVAVADFDYSDTSGEAVDQTAQHRDRMAIFASLLRDSLQRDHRVVRPDCPQPPCTAGAMAAGDLVAAARRDGARYLVYGGIRKMSTLVQWGEVQLLDVDRDQLVLRRTVTFRGDTDMAFRRAAEFVGETVRDAMAGR
jgi:opacity protein-like surface antigen